MLIFNRISTSCFLLYNDICIWEFAVVNALRQSMCACFRLRVHQAKVTSLRQDGGHRMCVCVFGGVLLQNPDAIFQCVFVCVRASTRMYVCLLSLVQLCLSVPGLPGTAGKWAHWQKHRMHGTLALNAHTDKRPRQGRVHTLKLKSFIESCNLCELWAKQNLIFKTKKTSNWFIQYIKNRFVWFTCTRFLQDKIMYK